MMVSLHSHDQALIPYLLETFSQVTLVLRMAELQYIFPQKVLQDSAIVNLQAIILVYPLVGLQCLQNVL